MGDAKDPADEGPSLELPSLFRRRQKPPPPEPAPEPAPEPVVERAPEPAAEPTVVIPEPEEDTEPTVVLPEPAPARRSVRDRLELRRGPAAEDRPAPGPESTPVGAVEPPRVAPIEPRVAKRDDEPAAPRVPLSERARAAVPEMAAGTAAAVVGVVVGLLGCVATWIGLQGCEVATGAQTCGGPGLLILVAIVVGQVVLGAALLKVVGVPEAGNVSFLGVGLMVVIALLVLIDHLYDGWMFLAIPAVTAATFAAARWITTRYADDTDDYPSEQHDIR